MQETHRLPARAVCAVICLLTAITIASAAPDAICVPWTLVGAPSHSSYSGATIRLKGIARGDATEFRWEFGDGGSTAWGHIANAYDLSVQHAYTGVPGTPFVATLRVRNAASQEDYDTYRIKLYESSDLTIPDHLQIRVRMAIDEALWSLHVQMQRAGFGAGAPGYGQPYGYWNDPGGYPLAASCTAVDAFQISGHRTNADNDHDPYVETVRRALNYILTNAYSYPISVQPAGNPDQNGNGIGIVVNQSSNLYDSRQTYIGGICMTALASSGAPNRTADVGGTNVYLRPYADIVQDMADFFAWGQVDSGSGRGGWRYYGNYSNSDMSTTQWPPLALIAAEANMGTIVPAFVRTELIRFLDYVQRPQCDWNHGGFGYSYNMKSRTTPRPPRGSSLTSSSTHPWTIRRWRARSDSSTGTGTTRRATGPTSDCSGTATRCTA